MRKCCLQCLVVNVARQMGVYILGTAARLRRQPPHVHCLSLDNSCSATGVSCTLVKDMTRQCQDSWLLRNHHRVRSTMGHHAGVPLGIIPTCTAHVQQTCQASELTGHLWKTRMYSHTLGYAQPVQAAHTLCHKAAEVHAHAHVLAHAQAMPGHLM